MYIEMIQSLLKNNQGGIFLTWLMENQEPENQLIGLQEFIQCIKSDLKSNPSPEKLKNFREIYPDLKKLIQKVELHITLKKEANHYKQEYKKLKLEMQRLREINPNLFDE